MRAGDVGAADQLRGLPDRVSPGPPRRQADPSRSTDLYIDFSGCSFGATDSITVTVQTPSGQSRQTLLVSGLPDSVNVSTTLTGPVTVLVEAKNATGQPVTKSTTTRIGTSGQFA